MLHATNISATLADTFIAIYIYSILFYIYIFFVHDISMSHASYFSHILSCECVPGISLFQLLCLKKMGSVFDYTSYQLNARSVLGSVLWICTATQTHQFYNIMTIIITLSSVPYYLLLYYIYFFIFTYVFSCFLFRCKISCTHNVCASTSM